MDLDGDPCPIALIPTDALQQVFGKLPFSDLIGLRVICKKWNAMVCSLYFAPPHHVTKCVPVHFLNEELTVYNSRVKVWEKHPLSFFQERIRTTHLELLATGGGLMCFGTGKSDQLLVCNPISKLWKILQIPSTIGDEPIEAAEADPAPPCAGVMDSLCFNFSAGDHHCRPVLRKRTKVVGLLPDPVTGNHYSIVVASLHNRSTPRSGLSTLVYDSRTSSWKRGAEVPEGEEFSDGNAVRCNGSLYYLVKLSTFDGELFRYDLKNDRWSTLSLEKSVMRCKLVENCGRVLLVQRDSYYSDESAFRFFQLRNKSTDCRSASRAHKIPAFTTDDDLSVQSLEETDLLESLNLDAVRISKVSGHLKSPGRGCVFGQSNRLYVVEPPYEDGLKMKRTLVTIIDLSTVSYDVLPEMIVASTTNRINNGSIAPEKHRIENVFHLFSASLTVQV